MVGKVGVQVAPTFLVLPDYVVHPFDGDTHFTVALTDTGNGLQRPMSFETLFDVLPILFRQLSRSPGDRFSHLEELLRIGCDIVAVHVGVSFYLPADG